MKKQMHLIKPGESTTIGDKVKTACGKTREVVPLEMPTKYACRECFEALYNAACDAAEACDAATGLLLEIRFAHQRLDSLVRDVES